MSVSIDAADPAEAAARPPIEAADARVLFPPPVDPIGHELGSDEIQALAQVGSWELDPSSGRAIWSDELCRIFGRPVGHTPSWEEFLSYVHADDRGLVSEVFAGTRTEGETGAVYRILRPNDEIRVVRTMRHRRPGGDGSPADMFGTVQDVTDQQRAQQAHLEAHELFETAFSQAPIGMALVGLDGRWLRVNAAVTRITGWTQDELLAGTFQDITHPDDLEADLAQIERLLAGEIPGYQMEKRYLTKDGSEIWVNLSVSLVRDHGRPRHFISQIEDISERKHAQARLQQAEFDARTQRDHAQAIISAMHDGYALTVDGELKVVNEALCALTGFSEAELVGAKVPFPFWPPEHLDETLSLRRQILAQEGGSFEMIVMRRNGERFEAEVTAKPARDADGNVFGFVNTMRDVGVQRRQQRELERLARTDALTGLANRHVLQAALDRAAEAARRQGQRLALVLLDIDWFKQVNDQHGHPAGDAILIEVAQRLTATVRAGEVLARVGGEEFAWVLPEARISDALLAADRARTAISAVPFAAAGRLTMSAGVGVMHAPADGDALYRLADRALYEAKQGGRNRTSCLTSGLGGRGADPGSAPALSSG